MMEEDDERQRKLQAGKAKLAEYRQRKALSDGQKKQKKKKKREESQEQRRDDEDQTEREERGDQTTVFSLSKTLRSGETVNHDQTYTIEPESEVSTTAEDCSSEVNGFQEGTGKILASVMADEDTQDEPEIQSGSPTQIMQDELAAKTLAMEELNRELEEIRAVFGADGVQQLQDFEEALKQRDEIITQLTTNLQQARLEKEEVMREFLELTEQSQKLQIQFQQLQAGEILRSSSISSTAADLLQARQQISLYQQQLEERDAQVKGHQEKTQEHLLFITQLKERLDQADKVCTQAEGSFSQSLKEKDLMNAEQQGLISDHLQTISQLQDELLTTTKQLDEVNTHLCEKSQELEHCERELSISRQKERMSSTEILQLMKSVEDLQQRCHQGSQSEGHTIQRIEEDWKRRMDQLRAELDEMYGQQIVQMKQELRIQHASEMDQVREQHSEDMAKIILQHHSELERFKGQLSHSTGDVNILNVRLIELQQKLQESQVFREKAEKELMKRSAENIDLGNEVERLHQELQFTRAQEEIRSKSPERSQKEMQMLRDAISDLQAQLDAAQKTNSDMEVNHESEITNYKIKLDMLEREKDAVLDRMAESQEAELERLRTQLLFSHEEELSRLRQDLHRESMLNGENLRDEMAVRHREAVELLRMDFQDKLRSVENERMVLVAEKGALLEEISDLKIKLNRALESSHADELVTQLQELQREVDKLKLTDKNKEEHWENKRQDMESENKILKETNIAMRDELVLLKEDLQKTQHLCSENQQMQSRLKELQDEIEKQKNTFSFAEKNFEVNYQELKDEYTCLVNAKVQVEERLIKESMDYETRLRDLQLELQTRNRSEDEKANRKPLVEKDTTELMEKLQTSESEKKIITQRLSESIAQVTLMEADIKRLEEELKRDRGEIVQRNKETVEVCSVAGGACSLKAHHTHVRSLKEETETLKLSLLKAEGEPCSDREQLHVLRQEERPEVYRDPSSQPAEQRSKGGERETPASTTAESLAEQTHAAAAVHEDLLTESDGRHPQQVNTDYGDSVITRCLIRTQDMDDSDHEECQLQLEAQRISLSQIHAAQLELLTESLHVQMEAQLRSREQELQELHERELRDLQEEMKSKQQEVRGQSAESQEHWVQLEERHTQEMERLKIYYNQQMEETQQRCTAEILLLKTRLQDITGTQQLFSMPSVPQPLTADKLQEYVQSLPPEVKAGLSRELQAVQKAQSERSHLQEEHQELLEEEIAKVIVQMSVEFAQHTEHKRLSKQAIEMSASTQTLNTEEQTCPGVPVEYFGSELVQQEEEHTHVLEALRASHTHQIEILHEQNTHLTTQIHTLNQQLQQELMKENRRQSDYQIHPRMQSCSTQTEQKRDEEQETKSRGHEEPVTSQQSAEDLSYDVFITERDLLCKSNSRLRQVLVDVLKTTAAAEETIGRHVEGILQGSSKESFKPHSGPAGDASFEAATEDVSGFSGLEMSQGAELQLHGAEFELEKEEYLMSISTRLQSAVKKLFITITETTTELEHARITQTELLRENFRHNEEIEGLLLRQEELQERLREEARAREQLALELHKAEGLIDGYTGERLALEQQARERADLQHHLEQELHVTSSRLHELEHERQQIQQERELLSRQQDAMRDGAGSRELRLVEAALDAAPEADLLGETEKLMAEKVEVQLQAQKESTELHLRVKQMETELEEQVNRVQELEETHRTEVSDLTQQIQALEKQLEKNRKFMDEQAADREHERDVFQQEIQNLEQQLKNPLKTQTGSERRDREVQELSSALQEKSDWCSELLLSSEQLQRDVQERDEEIETLGARVRELEHTLMHRVEEVQHVSVAGKEEDVTLESQLQTEREALDRKEKEILNLEEQLEQFREELENKSEEVNQLNMQLEIQRKEISSHQQDLQDQSQLTQVLEEKDSQISFLNAQISNLQHTGTETQKEVLEEKNEIVRQLESQVEHLMSEHERLKRNKDEEMDQLNSVIEKLQQELLNIEHKQPNEEDASVGKDDNDEMKQKMDEVTKELDTLKSDHRTLLSKYEDLKEKSLARRHTEMVDELEDALREKTAAFVVVQAQVQALQESASSKVMDLKQRVEELEICVEEKESELRVCRIKVEEAQSDAKALYCKVTLLEEKLREKVAAVLVSQAQLGAVQTQSKELHDRTQDSSSKHSGPRTLLEPEGLRTQSEVPNVRLESAGSTMHSEDTRTQSKGPSVQMGPKMHSEVPSCQLESEGHETQFEGSDVRLESERPKTQSIGPVVQLETEFPRTKSEGLYIQLESGGPKTQSEGPVVQLEFEGSKTQSEGPKTQSKGPDVHSGSGDPKTQPDDPDEQFESEGHETQFENPDVQLESKGHETQSEGPDVQPESEGPKTQSEGLDIQPDSGGPKTQSKGPDVQFESEGHETQLENPDVQLDSKGNETQPGGPDVQPESKGNERQSGGPDVQPESEGPKSQSEGPKTQSESKGNETQSEGPKTQSESKGNETQSEGPKTQSEVPDVQFESQSPKTQVKSQSEMISVPLETIDLMVQMDSTDLRTESDASSSPGKVSLLIKKLKELDEGLSIMQKDQELQKLLLCSTEEEVQEYEGRLTLLMDLLSQMRCKSSQRRGDLSDEVSDGGQSVSEVLQQLQEVKAEAASTKEELKFFRELNHKLQQDIELKEITITQLQTALTQVSAGTHDEDTAEAEKLLQDLQEVRGQLSITQEELESFRDQSIRLQELLQEREMNIALLKDQVHRTSRDEDGASELLLELQEVKDEAASTKEELNTYRERSFKLQEQIEVRDVSIAQLKEEIKELRTALTRARDELPSQPINKNEEIREHYGKNKSADSRTEMPPVSHEISRVQSHHSIPSSSLNGNRVDAGTQADLNGAFDVQEMITGYTEKIEQMQELHAAEIMDMEARHISESESLKRDRQQLEEQIEMLRDALEKLRSAEGPSSRSEQPSVSPFKEEYISDSSSEWSQRTGYDLPHLHQELRTTPDGARRDVEPDVLPDRIKSLLREVHQEGMQVLSLSEADRSEEHIHSQTWSLERDNLINSVQCLKDLITKIQIDTRVDGDWRAELLAAVQRVFVQERHVLKNILHSHMERLNSTDAVIHLNQLQREITEQDVRHRDVMGLLGNADRNSLITEIHQLRAQLNTQCHPVDTSGITERESDELQTELKQTQLELESSLKCQQRLMKDLDTLRAEITSKTAEIDVLNDTLANEQKRVRELQWIYEKDQCKADRKQEAEKEEVEDLKLMLEEQRSRVAELERERQTSAQIREQTDLERMREVSNSSELQVQLEAQRCRAAELSSALEREKHLNAQLTQQMQMSITPTAGTHDTLLQTEATCSQVEAGVLSVESLLQTLQSQLAEKQTQVVQLMEQLERQKLDELQCRRQFEQEKSSLTRSTSQDQSELRTSRDTAARLERQMDELQRQLDTERDHLQRLERERDSLQERVRQLEEKLKLLENNLSARSDNESADRTLDWVLKQKTSETQDSRTLSGAIQSSDPKHMNNILNRLQLIASRINSLTNDTSDRLSVGKPDQDSLAWLHNNVQDVMSLLQHIPSAPSALPEISGVLTGSSSSLLNERLLRQNAELTGFVSRLTEEKNDLRNQILRLEEELHRHRQRNFNTSTVSLRSSAERHESERDAWIQERSHLEKSLRQAEAELSRLRAEIRSDVLRDLTGSDVDNSTLKKIYSKYLRAESFRKALIYQKRYLLLLLGGFQECEEATLSLIARMGGYPTHTCLESLGHRRRGFTRFRSVVRVSIALSRMKFLVKRWQRTAGGTLTSQIMNRNGQIAGTDVKNETSYLHPGGVDLFRERRVGSRGRTGRESPRSAASVTHRYPSMTGESGGLSCSHLQNYDPDRALTDYISRLEALQRRLGSVQSGSYTQLHFGVRR